MSELLLTIVTLSNLVKLKPDRVMEKWANSPKILYIKLWTVHFLHDMIGIPINF